MNCSLKITIFIFLAIMAVRCAPAVTNGSVFNAAQNEYAVLRATEFQKEIDRLKGIVQQAPPTAETPSAHMRLALLYSHYRNPAPDYFRALEHLRTYVALDSEGGKPLYVQNWLSMLGDITNTIASNLELSASSRELDKSNQELKEKVDQLKKEVARLEKENTEVKEKLEKLKYLDIELEQKRKLVK